MNDQPTEAIAALTLDQTKNGWDAASHYWIGRATEQLEQNPSEHYRKVVELDSSHWYEILIRQRAQDSNTTSDINDIQTSYGGDFQTPIEHIGLWSQSDVHICSCKIRHLSLRNLQPIFTPHLSNRTFRWKRLPHRTQ